MAKYCYRTATGNVEIEVDEKWLETLKKLDTDSESNARKEHRHVCSLDHMDFEGEAFIDPNFNLEERFIKEFEKEALMKAIDELKPAQKRVIMMFYFENKTQAEIASLLGVSQSAVSQRITTAEKNLKKLSQKTL